MKKLTGLLAVVALGAGIALVGCGSDDDSSGSTAGAGGVAGKGTGGTAGKGTGGTAGVSYLRKMLDVVLFPELFALRTEL